VNFAVMYRGPLTSCNYSCHYCPFAKRTETAAQLVRDQSSLQRFTKWIGEQTSHQWKVLFTPWGEALVRHWYRNAIIELSKLSHVQSVAIQTNLSCGLDWISACHPERIAFWATFHAGQTQFELFVRKVRKLYERQVRLSVGMVAVPDHMSTIIRMRQELPSDVYLWLNAQQPRSRRYTDEEISQLTEIDPQFPITLRRARSFGEFCPAGETTFTVDGTGSMRRCHFVDEVIGNVYSPDWEMSLRPRPCPNRFCDCFLGKGQLHSKSLQPIFGEQLLERIASSKPVEDPAKVAPD
jgi:MoaA/NifB/PqqE/SkfB family radical SAM enzyme